MSLSSRADSAMGIQREFDGKWEERKGGEKQKIFTVDILGQADSRFPCVTEW